MPRSLSGTSVHPVKRFSRFHVLSPWRSRTRVPGFSAMAVDLLPIHRACVLLPIHGEVARSAGGAEIVLFSGAEHLRGSVVLPIHGEGPRNAGGAELVLLPDTRTPPRSP